MTSTEIVAPEPFGSGFFVLDIFGIMIIVISNLDLNMQKELKNHAFIDSQNLNLGIQELGWKLVLIRQKLEYNRKK